VIFRPARGKKSQQNQEAVGKAAYHGEIGREATALDQNARFSAIAYHGEIGREATAAPVPAASRPPAYHGEIGREATA
jgi:hypothetical protein